MFSKISYTLLFIVIVVSVMSLFVYILVNAFFQYKDAQLLVDNLTDQQTAYISRTSPNDQLVFVLRMVVIGLVCWIFEIMLISYLMKKTLFPLENLAQMVTTDSSEVPDLTKFGSLKNEVGRLSGILTKHYQQCQKYQDDIEQAVSERTKQLEQALQEEKKMNALMVNREIEMSQLKTEIKRLKGME